MAQYVWKYCARSYHSQTKVDSRKPHKECKGNAALKTPCDRHGQPIATQTLPKYQLAESAEVATTPKVHEMDEGIFFSKEVSVLLLVV